MKKKTVVDLFCGAGGLSKGFLDASYATAGAGVEYAGVRLDFAWLFAGHEYLARNTFWVSLGYSF